MENDWPPLEECPQFRKGLMNAAVYRYPWEEDDYAFDFDAFYPPLPDGPPWLRKLLVVTKDMVRPMYKQWIEDDDRKYCPICNPHVDLGTAPNTLNFKIYPEIGEHPVWDMDPIPIPFHILDHFYGQPGSYNECPRLVTPEQLESTKKFVKDLRATRGYKVDTVPHRGLVSSVHFFTYDLELDGKIPSRNIVENGLSSVIDLINSKTGKSYQLIEVLKLISTMPTIMYFVTFAAVASPAAPEIFIATLKSFHFPSRKKPLFKGTQPNPDILECLLLPDYDAPCETKPAPLLTGLPRILSGFQRPIIRPLMFSMPTATEKSVGTDLIPASPMEKNWPPLEVCPQYLFGIMNAALYRYPWEEDGYVFDFDSFYPPLPDGPPWLRKLLVSTKNMVRPLYQQWGVENWKHCPICYPHVDLSTNLKPKHLVKVFNCYVYPEIGEHPVWDMDPIPCPFHILDHFYPPGASSTINECPRLVTPEQLESTKRFVNELRASRGYCVDSIPHRGLVTSINFLKPKLDCNHFCRINGQITFRNYVENGLGCVIDHISSKTGKCYQLIEVLKVISTTPMYLVIFEAAASPAAPETFIASLETLRPPRQLTPPFKQTNTSPNILECLLLPGYDAPCETKLHLLHPMGYYGSSS